MPRMAPLSGVVPVRGISPPEIVVAGFDATTAALEVVVATVVDVVLEVVVIVVVVVVRAGSMSLIVTVTAPVKPL